MATTRWRSSLSNIETRLRRSLGLAGPIELELAPNLTPVVICDDATRPGTASEVRGRRWRTTKVVGLTSGQNGTVWLYVEQPQIATTGSQNTSYVGGVIVDAIEIGVGAASVASSLQVGVAIFATPLVLAPGIPVAVTTKDVYFVDPMKFDGELAPLSTGSSATQTLYAARPIWEFQLAAPLAPAMNAPIRALAGDLFLNWNSCLVVGTGVALGGGGTCNLWVTIAGRVF